MHWTKPESTWTKKSITDSIGIYTYGSNANGPGGAVGDVIKKVSTAIFGTDVYSYEMTLWERTLGLIGVGVPTDSVPGNLITSALSVVNLLYGHGKSGIFLGGNAFQVLGFLNKEGFTDKSNVTPTRIEDLVTSNLANLVLE